jgi:hypothetical protein
VAPVADADVAAGPDDPDVGVEPDPVPGLVDLFELLHAAIARVVASRKAAAPRPLRKTLMVSPLWSPDMPARNDVALAYQQVRQIRRVQL